jgi:methylenetetrahydrofolate dehydrogenase (NADP+) / methenyltetrahydrofolate cyclohydrolase
MVKIINGKEMAAKIRGELKVEVEKIVREKKFTPKLDVILVGDDPGSQIYVRNKEKACQEVGISSETHRLPATTKQGELNGLIQRLNQDKKVNGILVQLPLPKGLDPIAALNLIDPAKDVDGIHPLNMGNLLRGEKPLFLPCTPSGIMEMVLSTGVSLEGKTAVVVGRSNIVGKPIAVMLLQKNATVTVCHSKTRDLAETVRSGDVVVAAVGSPELVRGEMIKEGAIVIDVGMNRVGDRWVGDVDYDGASKKAAYLSPVPGGVGPMTIAMLLKNTVLSAERAGRSAK